MPARLITSPEYEVPEAAMAKTVWLSAHSGLERPRSARSGFLDPFDPATIGIEDDLVRHIAHWVRRYTSFGEGLPYGHAPEDCVEFPVESHNGEGETIAREVARALDDDWVVRFRPLQRKNHYHVSRLLSLRDSVPTKLRTWGDGTPILADTPNEDESFPGKWVRFMFDQSASCLWDATGASDVIEELPVAPAVAQALAKEIDVLYERWERWDDVEIFGKSRPPDYLVERRQLAEAGLAIAKRIKAALPDDWTVVYFDEERAARRVTRSAFEYRV